LLSDGYFQEHILRGVLTSGEVFSMPACAIVKILGNKIVSLDEYLDSNHIKPLLSV
jgi:ketosteroid isomerase-like protein